MKPSTTEKLTALMLFSLVVFHTGSHFTTHSESQPQPFIYSVDHGMEISAEAISPTTINAGRSVGSGHKHRAADVIAVSITGSMNPLNGRLVNK